MTRMNEPRVLRSASALSAWRANLRPLPASTRAPLALVPTMGALHEGHLSLIKIARAHAHSVLVSVFVNPTQFNDASDFEQYPRDESRDIELALSAGADAVFIPTPDVVYPEGAQTRVRVGALSETLCGATRPGHFEGVCTVVLALFQLTRCDVAVFGAKDYQQLTVIKRMTRDLHLPVEVIGAPTLREPDGLAMSSRNLRLSDESRDDASSIYRALCAARSLWHAGERDVEALKLSARDQLSDQVDIDYLEVCDADSLELRSGVLASDPSNSLVIAIACFLGEVRLIDNLLLSSP